MFSGGQDGRLWMKCRRQLWRYYNAHCTWPSTCLDPNDNESESRCLDFHPTDISFAPEFCEVQASIAGTLVLSASVFLGYRTPLTPSAP